MVESYRGLFSEEGIIKLIAYQKKWEWLSYLIIPVIILIRTFLVSICLSVGLFFYDVENKIKFKNFFGNALIAEFVLVFIGLTKLLYFLMIKTDFTIQDIQNFYPLSYINFLNIQSLEPWLIYPLQLINIFEIGYFFLLVYGLHRLLKNRFWKSFEIIAVSYGTGLTIWIGLVMFLTLSMT